MLLEEAWCVVSVYEYAVIAYVKKNHHEYMLEHAARYFEVQFSPYPQGYPKR